MPADMAGGYIATTVVDELLVDGGAKMCRTHRQRGELVCGSGPAPSQRSHHHCGSPAPGGCTYPAALMCEPGCPELYEAMLATCSPGAPARLSEPENDELAARRDADPS